jgi:hypothetical protein
MPTGQRQAQPEDLWLLSYAGLFPSSLSYMGPDGVLKTDVYTPWYRRCAGAAFSLMWCLVGLGVPCLFVRSRIQHFYSRLFSRIGMLGMEISLVIRVGKWNHLWNDSSLALT